MSSYRGRQELLIAGVPEDPSLVGEPISLTLTHQIISTIYVESGHQNLQVQKISLKKKLSGKKLIFDAWIEPAILF